MIRFELTKTQLKLPLDNLSFRNIATGNIDNSTSTIGVPPYRKFTVNPREVLGVILPEKGDDVPPLRNKKFTSAVLNLE